MTLAEAVKETLAERQLSLRAATIKTGIAHTTILKMQKGYIPRRSTICDWAVGLGDSINKWLVIAGYQPLPDNADKPPSGPVQRAEGENGSEHGEGGQNASPAAGAAKSGALVQFTHPDPPREVYDAIAMAETNEDKIQIAWDYIRRPELKLRFGAHRADRADIRLDIIRHYEEITGIRLLPPEVY